MKKITIALVLFLTLGLVFTSCDDAKKDAKEVGKETKREAKKADKEIKRDAKKVENTVDEEVEKVKDELAMNDYQCPMKCEGDKVYHEPGECPKCNMDLKKVEKVSEAEEENHEGHEHE